MRVFFSSPGQRNVLQTLACLNDKEMNKYRSYIGHTGASVDDNQLITLTFHPSQKHGINTKKSNEKLSKNQKKKKNINMSTCIFHYQPWAIDLDLVHES